MKDNREAPAHSVSPSEPAPPHFRKALEEIAAAKPKRLPEWHEDGNRDDLESNGYDIAAWHLAEIAEKALSRAHAPSPEGEREAQMPMPEGEREASVKAYKDWRFNYGETYVRPQDAWEAGVKWQSAHRVAPEGQASRSTPREKR